MAIDLKNVATHAIARTKLLCSTATLSNFSAARALIVYGPTASQVIGIGCLLTCKIFSLLQVTCRPRELDKYIYIYT